jgi:hypothetical protein
MIIKIIMINIIFSYLGIDDDLDLVRELLPVMISFLDLNQKDSPTALTDYLLLQNNQASSTGIHIYNGNLEDVIRYGGDRSMVALTFYKSHLHEAYRALERASSSVLSQSQSSTQFDGNNYMDSPKGGILLEGSHTRGEVLLSVVCKYLSCCGLLHAGKIARIAKRSLHVRLRPLVLSKASTIPVQSVMLYVATDNSSHILGPSDSKEDPKNEEVIPTDVVTVSIAEFEEMFLRCALAVWEVSGALSSNPPEPNPAVLLQYCIKSEGNC